MADEHQRLADAASRLVHALHPDFVGDLPTALDAMADVLEDLDFGHDPTPRLVAALEGVRW